MKICPQSDGNASVNVENRISSASDVRVRCFSDPYGGQKRIALVGGDSEGTGNVFDRGEQFGIDASGEHHG